MCVKTIFDLENINAFQVDRHLLEFSPTSNDSTLFAGYLKRLTVLLSSTASVQLCFGVLARF